MTARGCFPHLCGAVIGTLERRALGRSGQGGAVCLHIPAGNPHPAIGEADCLDGASRNHPVHFRLPRPVAPIPTKAAPYIVVLVGLEKQNGKHDSHDPHDRHDTTDRGDTPDLAE
jgi:hypothetical protein